MQRHFVAAEDAPPTAALIQLALAHAEASASFRSSPRHRALLSHLVSRVLGNEQVELKETVIAVEVFGRSPASFDPRLDTIVRVEARRLRARLAEYYRGEGRDAEVRIELPVGSYVPLFAKRSAPRHDEAVTRRARDLVERGDHYLRQALSRNTLEQALERFDLALRESPGFVPALVGLGRAWLNLGIGWYRDPSGAADHAGEALRRAVEIDPSHAIAHVLLGAVQHQFDRDWPAAQRSFRRALRIGPQQAFVHSACGRHLMLHGDHDEAARELDLARTLDPQYVNTRIHLVNPRIGQGRLADAAAEIEAMRDIAPDTVALVGMQALIAMIKGDAESAVRLYERACDVSPDYPGCFVALAGAHALAGRVEVADRLMDDTRRRFDERFISPYVVAIFAVRCGRRDAAFAMLARALAERDPNAIQIAIDPSFDATHGDPRWPALAAAAGAPHRRLAQCAAKLNAPRAAAAAAA